MLLVELCIGRSDFDVNGDGTHGEGDDDPRVHLFFRATIRILLQVGEHHCLDAVPEVQQERLQRAGGRYMPQRFAARV